jgi:hypothetical protein
MSSFVPIFLWNNHVAAPGTSFRPLVMGDQGGDVVTAFRDYVEQIEPKPAAIRILYGSPTLNQKATSCTKGSREDVRLGLTETFAALSRPETKWATHKINLRAGGAEATTIVYTDESETLDILRSLLSEIGVKLEGAFPILTALEALPAIGNRSIPVVALLRSKFGALVYLSTDTGFRNVRVFQAEYTEAELNAELEDGFATIENKGKLLFLVLNASIEAMTLESHGVEPTDLKVDELLQAVSNLELRGLTNLLPPSRKVRPEFIIYGVSLVLLLGGLLAWNSYEQQIRRSDRDIAARTAEVARIETDNGRLLANKQRIEKAEAVLNEASVAPAVKMRFLHALNAARPVAISIRSATLTDHTWSVSGFIHEGLGEEKGPYQTFLKNLGESKEWDLAPDSQVTVQKTQDFTINGTFK